MSKTTKTVTQERPSREDVRAAAIVLCDYVSAPPTGSWPERVADAVTTIQRLKSDTMTWQTDPKGCGNCVSCGMDMDMEPYCANTVVIARRIAEPDAQASYRYGLAINRARPICAGDFFHDREARSQCIFLLPGRVRCCKSADQWTELCEEHST